MYLVHENDVQAVSCNRKPGVAIENAFAQSWIPNHQMEALETCNIVLLTSGETF